MASFSSSWTAPSLARYRPAVLVLTALAAGCTIYYIHEQIWSSSRPPKASLQRSNAQRQRRRPRRRRSAGIANNYLAPGLTGRPRYVPDVPWGTVPVFLDFLTNAAFDEERFGDHLFLPSTVNTLSITTPLRRRMPSQQDIRGVAADDEESLIIRRELEEAFLCFYFWKHIAPSTITDEQRDIIISQLGEDGGFSADIITTVLQWHQTGILTERIEWWEQLIDGRRRSTDEGQIHQQDPVNGALASTMQALEGRETVADVDSEHSWREESGTNDGQDDSNEGQNLGNLLWGIAEEQARKESYIHRGVTCNSCNAMPIKGIRYRCSNCVDFDLCEQCEALQVHPRTHLFYKVRIPAPFLGNSRQPQPVWYPGRPTTARYSIPKQVMEKIKEDTGYQAVEVEALWEQFRCLAATEWDDDPCEYNLAIDRKTFDRCFIPNTSTRPPAPNLIYDRAFSFYDVDNDGLIGFGEFINGRAALNRDKPHERWKRVFKGYDINNDGFIDRRDFLRMFRAYYALTKELTLDVINGIEDDVSENGARDIILGSQPISSAFSGAIPLGERLRTDEGKTRDHHGDYQLDDRIGVVDDRDYEVANFDEVLADSTEAARFGTVQSKGHIGRVVDEIKNDTWPPPSITGSDLHKVFPHLNELKDVSAVQDQDAIRRVALERVAREHQQRQFVRRIAVRNRKQRQFFYLDAGDAAKEEKHSESEHEGVAGSLRKTNKSRKDNLVRILASSKADEFRMRLIDCVKFMEWPLETPERLINDVFELIFNEWGGREIAEDLCGYGSLQHDAIDFVATFDSLISHMSDAIKNPGHQKSADEQRKSLPSSSSRRSRSSSKVRFHDDICTDNEHDSRSRATSISSRSIPHNERWGGFAPEPEKDVGRDVLYQVTQEALNELLDPVFRLREDLALADVRTRNVRERHRADIITSVKEPREIKRYLDIYQSRWRLRQQSLELGYFGIQEIEETFGADGFLAFISRNQVGELNKQTKEHCSRCKLSGVDTWVWAGTSCTKCGKPPAEAREPPATDPGNPPTLCSNCGKVVLYPPIWDCSNCGVLSKEIIDETEKLWKIIRGSQDGLEERQVIQDEGELKSSPNEEVEPLFSPKTLEDLHSSVVAFNQASSLALEGTIAQKPLKDLLGESGYAAASPSSTSKSPSPPSDPTLPQNRPDKAFESGLGHQLDGTSDVEASASASFQHNVRTTHTRTPTVYLREPPNPATPDPTLPQNRPNSLTTASIRPNSEPPTSTYNYIPKITPKVTVQGVSPTNHRPKNQSSDEATPDSDTLVYYAALDILAAEDRERGGPGRLSFAEWEEIMKGEKGQSLGFLSSWIEIASF